MNSANYDGNPATAFRVESNTFAKYAEHPVLRGKKAELRAECVSLEGFTKSYLGVGTFNSAYAGAVACTYVVDGTEISVSRPATVGRLAALTVAIPVLRL